MTTDDCGPAFWLSHAFHLKFVIIDIFDVKFVKLCKLVFENTKIKVIC